MSCLFEDGAVQTLLPAGGSVMLRFLPLSLIFVTEDVFSAKAIHVLSLAVSLRRKEASWQENGLRSNRYSTGAPEEAQRKGRIPLFSVRKRIPSCLQAGAARADPHRRKTVLLLDLWPWFQPEGKS